MDGVIGTLKHKVCVEQPFAEGCFAKVKRL